MAKVIFYTRWYGISAAAPPELYVDTLLYTPKGINPDLLDIDPKSLEFMAGEHAKPIMEFFSQLSRMQMRSQFNHDIHGPFCVDTGEEVLTHVELENVLRAMRPERLKKILSNGRQVSPTGDKS